jgi:RHS repeat-associated protein
MYRLTSDTIDTAGGAQVAAISYGYNNDNDVTSETTSGLATPGGGTGTVTNTYGYDEANRLTSWTATPSGGTAVTKTYGYDSDGNLVDDNGVTYTYDARDQLVSDGYGNTYTYTPDGDLATQSSPGDNNYSFTSDAYGQQITDGFSSFSWDALDRVVGAGEAFNPSYSVALTYEGSTDQVASDPSATYSRDPAGQIVGVDTASGGKTLALVDGHDDLSGVFAPGGTTMTESTTWDPWGEELASVGPAIQVGYQGQWTDPVTQQVAMGSRFYRAPEVEGFINQDTDPDETAEAVTENLYAYADDNPMSVTDLSGHSPSSSASGSGTITQADVDAAYAQAVEAQQAATAAETAAKNAEITAQSAAVTASDAVQYARLCDSNVAQLANELSTAEQQATQAYAQVQADLRAEAAVRTQISQVQADLQHEENLEGYEAQQLYDFTQLSGPMDAACSATLATTIAEIEGNLNQLESNINSLSTKLGGLYGTLAGDEGDYNNDESDYQALEGKIGNLSRAYALAKQADAQAWSTANTDKTYAAQAENDARNLARAAAVAEQAADQAWTKYEKTKTAYQAQQSKNNAKKKHTDHSKPKKRPKPGGGGGGGGGGGSGRSTPKIAPPCSEDVVPSCEIVNPGPSDTIAKIIIQSNGENVPSTPWRIIPAASEEPIESEEEAEAHELTASTLDVADSGGQLAHVFFTGTGAAQGPGTFIGPAPAFSPEFTVVMAIATIVAAIRAVTEKVCPPDEEEPPSPPSLPAPPSG